MLDGEQSVGALIPETGDLGLLGRDVSAGVKVGVTDYNRELRESGTGRQMTLDLRDTQTTGCKQTDVIIQSGFCGHQSFHAW